ncbi:hypothetical protein P3X46_025408 [Hevea brasiliensis]|uniref:Uncharacterized protein n=1 Tax=Hevea brasiliensis TaxID=3981 RepID=A0ABQ9L5L9_HEVBR|nr:uncharacterized protein LOC110670424 [Hevea brasiliensis]KAJ9159960.1 hypothetical protein P3X46_025408 [Hevea brasiliensis]
MDAKAWNLKPVKENCEYLQKLDDDDDDEALSLCDLPLNSEAASDWDDFSGEDQSSSLDPDLFEFISEDFTSSASAYPKDNIIFCGKLISYKGENVDHEKEQNSDNTSKVKDAKKSCIFPWKSYSFNKLRSSSVKLQRKKSYRTCNTFLERSPDKKGADKYDFPMNKVSLQSSPSKSRWNLFAFGVGRYPMEMELNDIKTRQSKLSDSKMRLSLKRPAKTFRSDDRRELVDRSGKREKGWWGLLSIFGCKSYNANAMVKASLGFIPRV